jgi:hypothetical protein
VDKLRSRALVAVTLETAAPALCRQSSRSLMQRSSERPPQPNHQFAERPSWVCAVTRRRFPVGASPTRRPLQPEATGAVMEVTKWLKPSVSGSRMGDRASVQAATRVNAEQASKRTMCRPTRRPFRGRLIRLGDRAKTTPRRCTGVVAAACTQGKRSQHGKPQDVARDGQPDTREGSAGRPGVAERLVVPPKPGNAGGGKEP